MQGPEQVARAVRADADQSVFDMIDAELVWIARELGARGMHYPALISRAVLERAGYPESFPHLLLTASRFDGSASPWCLSPAVCYHVYAHITGRRLTMPIAVTARGACFRSEEHTAPGIRQIEFEMREMVFAGPRDWVREQSVSAAARVTTLARRLGLQGEWHEAEDPFFLPVAAGKAAMQRMLGLKEEYRTRDGLALASINRHDAFFGSRFDVRDRSGEFVHTACVAMGLDRWCAALPDVREKQEELCG